VVRWALLAQLAQLTRDAQIAQASQTTQIAQLTMTAVSSARGPGRSSGTPSTLLESGRHRDDLSQRRVRVEQIGSEFN